ncbi:hypothetical protein OSB04_014384 [Centaurea solstitialis]|uniref:Uncharacterized protein n=1 Tax=Centaurea solstitialis TaxID=347529 RepID=A0AA38WHP3_9ASTR|nr:hypothetical protein OSB04_014384 [Centaurea solstitialis]
MLILLFSLFTFQTIRPLKPFDPNLYFFLSFSFFPKFPQNPNQISSSSSLDPNFTLRLMEDSGDVVIDAEYEFSAPKFFDFILGETEDQMREAQLWFDTALTYAPSPFMHKVKTTRAVQLESLCDFSEPEISHKEPVASEATGTSSCTIKKISLEPETQSGKTEHDLAESKKDVTSKDEHHETLPSQVCDDEKKDVSAPASLSGGVSSSNVTVEQNQTAKITYPLQGVVESCTPKPAMASQNNKSMSQAEYKKQQTARRIASAVKNPSALKPRTQSQAKCIKTPATVKRDTTQAVANKAATPNLALENQAIKRQKLEGGKTRQGDASQGIQRKTKLTLTRPKEPDFVTSQRVRSVKIKSSAEIEEEMMAKIPKFKARPVNRKILEAPTLPAMKRSTPHLPEFQEFHLETMERAHQNAETSTVASTEAPSQIHQWKPHLTTPKTPPLQTLLRARPTKIKSTEELEQEELEKAPKFKARPLNKKIFESKGELGLFCNKKRQVTIPQEFHFAIDERIPPPTANVADLFDKLSLCSDSYSQKPIPRKTAPNPFHLHTEERGAEKEKRFVMEIIHKQIEDERARIPKATPYPYTTDYPWDPIPVPEKVRKPLTEVQEFDLQVEHRAVDRAEFDKKVKEKEMMYKRYRDEAESAKMMEDEKALKQLRRTLVPQARPVPNFSKPFLPRKSSKGVTKPKSPKLKIIERTERRRMVVAAATSSAASNMR